MGYKDPAEQRAYLRAWMAARRAEWFAGRVCAKCGSAERLELDHVDPAQKVNHRVWSWAKDRREAELAKCQALCFRCHSEKNKAARRAWLLAKNLPTHGTLTAYRNGCRCDSCRTAKQRAKRLESWHGQASAAGVS